MHTSSPVDELPRGRRRPRRRDARASSAGSPACPSATTARLAPLPPRPGRVQARLGARRADPVARARVRPRRDRPPRRHARRDRGLRAGARGRGRPAERPFVILAQHTLFDPTRAPGGQAHRLGVLPRPERLARRPDRRDRGAGRALRARLPRRSSSRGAVTAPADFEARNRNLVGGDINGGTMDLGQLLRAAGAAALNPYRTPLRASTSARPRRRPAAASTGCAATRRR